MTMKNSKNKSLILVLVLLAALAGALVLVNSNQETRRGAYFSDTNVRVLPDTVSATLGQEIPFELRVETANGAKVSTVDAKVCYGNGLAIEGTATDKIDLNKEAFTQVIEARVDQAAHCVRIIAISTGILPENLKSGSVKLATIRFKAVSQTSGKVEMVAASTTVGGYNPAAGATDTSIRVTTSYTASYTIGAGGGNEDDNCSGSKPADRCDDPKMLQINAQCYAGTTEWDFNDQLCDSAGRREVCSGINYCCPSAGGDWTTDMTACGGNVEPTIPDTEPTSPPTGDDSVLNFKIAYRNLASDAKCYENWPLKLIVMGGGVTRVYTNVSVSPDPANPRIMNGSIVLNGFTAKNGVAVFFKNSKSLQNKYGKDNQTEAYNRAGGELTLTNSASSSPVYDFTNYPLMPGDVVSQDGEVQDGLVNGIDFAYMKSKVVTHQTVNAGEYLQADLDGNCQLNSADVTVFKRTLEEKQGQLY